MTKQTFFVNLSLILAVLFSSWLCVKLPLNEQQTENHTDNAMDGFMANASYEQTDSSGHIQTQVSALTIEHFPLQNTSVFHYPKITLYSAPYNTQAGSKPSQPWHITADQGRAEEGIKKIRLQNNVKLEQYQGAQHHTQRPKLTLLTSSLDILPEQKIIETQGPVTLLQPGSVIKSRGVRVNMQEGSIELLSQASAHFDAFSAPWNIKK